MPQMYHHNDQLRMACQRCIVTLANETAIAVGLEFIFTVHTSTFRGSVAAVAAGDNNATAKRRLFFVACNGSYIYIYMTSMALLLKGF